MFSISMRGYAPLPARFFNYQSQPATFLVQPPTSNHSETPENWKVAENIQEKCPRPICLDEGTFTHND